jgi:hypothetical protein
MVGPSATLLLVEVLVIMVADTVAILNVALLPTFANLNPVKMSPTAQLFPPEATAPLKLQVAQVKVVVEPLLVIVMAFPNVDFWLLLDAPPSPVLPMRIVRQLVPV